MDFIDPYGPSSDSLLGSVVDTSLDPSGYVTGLDYSGGNINDTILPGDMSVGATGWDQVLQRGISRMFDVAGTVYTAKNIPRYQTTAGLLQSNAANTQRTVLLLFMGAALILVLKNR